MTVSSDPTAPRRPEPAWPSEAGIPPSRPSGAAATASAPQAAGPAAPADDASRASQPIGRLRRVDPVELWRSADFAAWLGQHLDEVAALIGTRLVAGPPGAASPGTVVATDAAGAQVRIVVELGASSDETFGMLMRQIVASGAKTAVWVCARARDEHLTSVEWLNREIDGQVHVISVDAVRIDDSVPAPILALALRASSSGGESVRAPAPPAAAASAPSPNGSERTSAG